MKQASVMLILNEEGKILAISRRNNPSKFGLPGGKVEPNEQGFQAAIRETFEETSVIVQSCTAIYSALEPRDVPTGEDFNTTCFYALTWKGIPKDSEEGFVKWMASAELTDAEIGAFPIYNSKALEAFKKQFPEIKIL